MPQVEEPYLSLARDVLSVGARYAKLHKRRAADVAMQGLPAAMQELALARGTLTPGELARRIGVTDARVANILKVMEERGWITRQRAEGDRRRVAVALTEEGRRESSFRRDQGARFCAAFLRELGEDDARDFVRILHRTCEVMDRMGREGFPPGPPDEEANAQADSSHAEEGR